VERGVQQHARVRVEHDGAVCGEHREHRVRYVHKDGWVGLPPIEEQPGAEDDEAPAGEENAEL